MFRSTPVFQGMSWHCMPGKKPFVSRPEALWKCSCNIAECLRELERCERKSASNIARAAVIFAENKNVAYYYLTRQSQLFRKSLWRAFYCLWQDLKGPYCIIRITPDIESTVPAGWFRLLKHVFRVREIDRKLTENQSKTINRTFLLLISVVFVAVVRFLFVPKACHDKTKIAKNQAEMLAFSKSSPSVFCFNASCMFVRFRLFRDSEVRHAMATVLKALCSIHFLEPLVWMSLGCLLEPFWCPLVASESSTSWVHQYAVKHGMHESMRLNLPSGLKVLGGQTSQEILLKIACTIPPAHAPRIPILRRRQASCYSCSLSITCV